VNCGTEGLGMVCALAGITVKKIVAAKIITRHNSRPLSKLAIMGIVDLLCYIIYLAPIYLPEHHFRIADLKALF
jgi:hypothetical protein